MWSSIKPQEPFRLTREIVPLRPGPRAIIRPAAEEAIAEKLRRYQEAARGAFAENTERGLRSDSKVFADWCAERNLSALPAAPETIVQFIDAMAESRKPSTVRHYVASIAHMHRAVDIDPNPAKSSMVTLALKRMSKTKPRDQKQALGLGWDLMRRILDPRTFGPDGPTLRDLRNMAMLSTAYDTLARRSELVALLIEDVAIGEHGDGSVVIRRSKTDQTGEGMTRYLSRETVALLKAWFSAAQLDSGLIFRAVLKGGNVGGALDPGEVARVFKELAEKAGLPPDVVKRLSGHSTRVGAAQDMASRQIELPAIMQSGGWKSAQMVARYTAKQAAHRSGAAQLARALGRS